MSNAPDITILPGRRTDPAGAMMRHTGRRTALALAALALVVALAGCGGATPGPSPSGSPPTSSLPPFASPSGPVEGTVPAGVRQIPVTVGSPPLEGTLTLPSGKGPFPAVVLLSGSGPNDQDETIGPNKPFRDIALGLAAKGIASVRFDKRTLAYPQSFATATGTPEQEYVPDALAAIRLLKQRPEVNPRRIFVLGHSQGGTYAPLVASRAPEVAGVILAAAGTEPLGAAMLRQMRYLATLPGTTGVQAKAQLPQIEQLAAVIGDPDTLKEMDPATNLMGGAGPAYFLSDLRYDEVATARALPQPLLLLQGDRDYQVTVADDLDVWRKGLKGRDGVSVVQFPNANHLFIDGSGPPNPEEYETPGHVDAAVIATIAGWVNRLSR